MEPIRTRILEVKVISGENLYLDWNPVTENAYVMVRTESLKCWTTKMAREGGGSLGLGYPIWNEKLLVEMPLHAKSITFEVQCKASNGMVRSIGLARIAISDVLTKEEGCLKVFSYSLRNWEGRRNGVIKFSVRIKPEEEKEDSMCLEMKGMRMVSSGVLKPMGVPVDHQHDMDADNNRVVMGIPVCWNRPGIHD